MWWFAPVILPIVMMQLMPKKAAVCCLSLMVCFNVLTTGIQYAPRLAHGTSAESDAYFWSGSQGVSWWMLRDVVDRISQIEDQRRQSGDTRPLTVQLCPVKYTLFTVPKTMELFDPQRAARIKWVYENEKNWDVSVQADPEAVYMKVIIRAAHAAEAPAK
jgi:hypothetical protein